MPKFPILLLAAGKSSRMGTPKQLLPWGNNTLFEQAISSALSLKNHPLFVVVGAYHEQLLPLIPSKVVKSVVNPQWEEGMGTSIAVGIKAVLKIYPNASGVLIFLVDQPLVDTHYLAEFFKIGRVKKGHIIASRYPDGHFGVPAFFDAVYFNELLGFSKDQGARTLIKKYSKQVIGLSGGDSLRDIDTPEAYQEMFAQFSSNPRS